MPEVQLQGTYDPIRMVPELGVAQLANRHDWIKWVAGAVVVSVLLIVGGILLHRALEPAPVVPTIVVCADRTVAATQAECLANAEVARLRQAEIDRETTRRATEAATADANRRIAEAEAARLRQAEIDRQAAAERRTRELLEEENRRLRDQQQRRSEVTPAPHQAAVPQTRVAEVPRLPSTTSGFPLTPEEAARRAIAMRGR